MEDGGMGDNQMFFFSLCIYIIYILHMMCIYEILHIYVYLCIYIFPDNSVGKEFASRRPQFDSWVWEDPLEKG